MAAGLIPLAVFGSAFIGAVLYFFSSRQNHEQPYILVVHCENRTVEEEAKSFVNNHVEKLSLKSKSVIPGQIELNYEVRLKGDDTEFINLLAEIPGISHTVLVSYNGDYMS